MKYLLVVAMLLSTCAPAVANCDKSETVVVGDKTVIIKDPLALLRQARNGGAKKISDYYCNPVLETVASDNDMTCTQFLDYTGIVEEFNLAITVLKGQVDEQEYRRLYDILLQQVVNSIVDQILAPRSEV